MQGQAGETRMTEIFFDGMGYDRDHIHGNIIGLINRANQHTTINVAIYNWGYTSQGIDIKNAVNRAAQRGSCINIVAGKCSFLDLFNSNINIKVFPTGSIGTRKMHNKFITISDNTVIQMSANFDGGMTGNHNNAVVINDQKIFDEYNFYFCDLQKGKTNTNYYRYIKGRSAKYKGYIFPRRHGDTILSILNNVGCSGSRIHIAMAYWSISRVKILEKLISMSKKGCDIKLIVRNAQHPVYQKLIVKLAETGLDYRLTSNSYLRALHSKYLLIDGTYAGKQRKVVFTGSHNYTGSSLRKNDEILLRIIGDEEYDSYIDNWTKIYNQS